MKDRIRTVGLIAVLASVFLGMAAPVSGVDTTPTLTAKAFVNRTGGITVMGVVDCSAAVADHWGSFANVPANTVVLVNVSWTAYQPGGGRTMLKAELDDSQASLCWANVAALGAEALCVENGDGIFSPCLWDSSNYGSDGYVYGNGKFKQGAVHVDVVLEGGWYDEASNSLDLYHIYSFDLRATRS